MAAQDILLCIHRDPGQLDLLRQQGYGLITATNGSDGLRLLMSQPVDAIVVEYYLGLMDGTVVADEIKLVKPHLPIVMVTESLDVPVGALKSVDALVAKADGPHSVWAAVHFLLNIERNRHGDTRRSVRRTRRPQAPALPELDEKGPFSPKVWKSIRNGTVQF